jgi:hypothetical protein
VSILPSMPNFVGCEDDLVPLPECQVIAAVVRNATSSSRTSGSAGKMAAVPARGGSNWPYGLVIVRGRCCKPQSRQDSGWLA